MPPGVFCTSSFCTGRMNCRRRRQSFSMMLQPECHCRRPVCTECVRRPCTCAPRRCCWCCAGAPEIEAGSGCPLLGPNRSMVLVYELFVAVWKYPDVRLQSSGTCSGPGLSLGSECKAGSRANNSLFDSVKLLETHEYTRTPPETTVTRKHCVIRALPRTTFD